MLHKADLWGPGVGAVSRPPASRWESGKVLEEHVTLEIFLKPFFKKIQPSTGNELCGSRKLVPARRKSGLQQEVDRCARRTAVWPAVLEQS